MLLAEEFERAAVRLLIVSHRLEQWPEGWLFFQMRGALAEYERVPTGRERGAPGGRSRRRTPGIWNEASVHKILTNEAYTGRAYFGKYRRLTKTTRVRRPPAEWIEIPVPAIVDEETFEATQRQLDCNRALATRNRKHEYLLCGGRFRCGRCGRTMTGTAPKGRRRYNCNSLRTPHDRETICRGLVAGPGERQVWDAVVRLLEQPEIIAAEVTKQEATADDHRAEIRRQMALLETALAKCERDDQRWVEAYIAEVITVAELKAYRADIDQRRQSLLAEQTQLQGQLEAIGHRVQQVESLIDYCARCAEPYRPSMRPKSGTPLRR